MDTGASGDPWRAWLARVQHDLIKRMLWPARDRRDLGGRLVPGELIVALVDDEGATTTAQDLWASLCQAAPEPEHAAFAPFAGALDQAVAAAAADRADEVLALEAAWRVLERSVGRQRGAR